MTKAFITVACRNGPSPARLLDPTEVSPGLVPHLVAENAQTIFQLAPWAAGQEHPHLPASLSLQTSLSRQQSIHLCETRQSGDHLYIGNFWPLTI